MTHAIKSKKLSIVIPPTPASMQTATETTVDDSKRYSQFLHQPYCSPVSPLKHPYRPRTNIEPELPEKQDAALPRIDLNLSLKAADVASPDLLAVASLFTSMKETLNRMTRTFDALGEQSQRMSSLPNEVKRVEDIRAARAELEEQILRQKMKMQELREKLEGEVRVALENKLRERLTSMIQESVVKEIEERVRQELAVQMPQALRNEVKSGAGNESEYPVYQEEEEYQTDLDTPFLSPEESGRNHLPRIPILLYQEPTDDEADHLDTPEKDYRMDPGTPVLSSEATMYPTVKIPILLFDDLREHEPPPPSPAPMAGPLRPLLRPLPTPEQSPAYVVHDTLPSKSVSVCATPITAYPRVPAPTPIINEPTFMVLPMRSVPSSALSPVPGTPSPLAPKDLNLLFAPGSEKDREQLRNRDLSGFTVPTPMAEWPKSRTIVKTPSSSRSSPLMIPPPMETPLVRIESESYDATTPLAPPETPVLIVPPPRPQPRAGNSFADNLKLLPPLIIT